MDKRLVVIYPDLSYKIVGCLYDVYNTLGFGYPEKVYQESLAREFQDKDLPFRREDFSRIVYKGKKVGSFFHDFIIDGKIVLELKVGNSVYESHLKQLLSYLKDSDMKLGILAVFAPSGLIYKRVIN